jgi:hypothetical protein
MIYKLYIAGFEETPNAVMTVDNSPQISFLFDLTNTDYTNFKKEINEETAELKDADGNVMTAEEAKQFIATLP